MLTTKWAAAVVEKMPGVTMKDHFGGDAYSANGRIFATFWHEENYINLRLSLEEQARFVSLDGEGFVEVEGGWGPMGFTRVHMEFVDRENFVEALKSAYEHSKEKRSWAAKTKKPTKKASKKVPKKAHKKAVPRKATKKTARRRR